MARCLLIAAPIYDKLLFVAVLISLDLLIVGLYSRNSVPLAFAGIPLAFLLLNALVLNSQDRMAAPAYPVLLANLALLPGHFRLPQPGRF
jgi:hypothetical protein